MLVVGPMAIQIVGGVGVALMSWSLTAGVVATLLWMALERVSTAVPWTAVDEVLCIGDSFCAPPRSPEYHRLPGLRLIRSNL